MPQRFPAAQAAARATTAERPAQVQHQPWQTRTSPIMTQGKQNQARGRKMCGAPRRRTGSGPAWLATVGNALADWPEIRLAPWRLADGPAAANTWCEAPLLAGRAAHDAHEIDLPAQILYSAPSLERESDWQSTFQFPIWSSEVPLVTAPSCVRGGQERADALLAKHQYADVRRLLAVKEAVARIKRTICCPCDAPQTSDSCIKSGRDGPKTICSQRLPAWVWVGAPSIQ